MRITDGQQLADTVRDVLAKQKVTDMHTHLYSPNFGDLLLWGVDELLTYHYLVAETMRWSDLDYTAFWKLSKEEQADLIWRVLFLEHSPISEGCRGALTTLQGFGLDVGSRNLAGYRRYFAESDVYRQVDRVLELANVDHVVMTNDPFDDNERPYWLNGTTPDARFHAALRIDPLLNDFARSRRKLRDWGFDVTEEWSQRSAREVTRFLREWIDRMKPLYMAVSLPATFEFPDDSDRTRVIQECILPISRELGIPFAMMIGTNRKVNPALGDAGDSLGKASIRPLEYLLANNPHNKFITTFLSRENQHELNVLGRKFRNLLIFGCWWFLNNPILIDEMTRMRFELLGTSVVPQHSDARVLDQLVYKWSHSKAIIGDILTEKYRDILATGWQLERSEIERDAADLLRNNFWRFVGRPDMVAY